jgi:sec-independent protein translocase protein TatB
MPGFGDSAFLILLALLLFGPKKLPVLARQLGKLMGDFRRASNEFRTQMEEELRISEQADRQKKVAALEAARPVATAAAPAEPAIDPYPGVEQQQPSYEPDTYPEPYMADSPYDPEPSIADAAEPAPDAAPIATSGDLSILPPATGLPVPNSAPAATEPDHPAQTQAELDFAAPPAAEPAESTPSAARESEYETESLHG